MALRTLTRVLSTAQAGTDIPQAAAPAAKSSGETCTPPLVTTVGMAPAFTNAKKRGMLAIQ